MGSPRRWKKGPVPIAEVVASVTKNLESKSSKREKIDSSWQKAVGKKKALHTKISTFENGTLTLRVDSSSILYELTLEKRALLGKLQKEFGTEKVKEIRLFHGT